MVNYTPNWTRRSRNNGYVLVFCPDHPRAWSTGFVYEHILVLEQKLDRLLLSTEVTHHKDHCKTNNSPDNLELVDGHSNHAKIHRKPTTMVDLICDWCGNPFQRRKGNYGLNKGYKLSFCGRVCMGKSAHQKNLLPLVVKQT